MGDLFNRDFSINLGGTLIEPNSADGKIAPILRVSFKVEKSLESDANSAEVTVYNLRENTRGLLSQANIETVLEAGYVGDRHVIFRGKLDYGATVRNGPDWVSTFESTDGGKELRESRINVSFKSVSVQEAMRQAANALGLDLGNLESKIAGGNVRGALQQLANGLVLSGPARGQFDKLTRSFGFRWSIQNEEIVLLKEGDDVLDPNQAIVLNPDTGLVGSPQAGDKGIVSARALLVPQLQPGRKVRIEAALVDGFFRVERSVFTGDTWGPDWFVDIEAAPL